MREERREKERKREREKERKRERERNDSMRCYTPTPTHHIVNILGQKRSGRMQSVPQHPLRTVLAQHGRHDKVQDRHRHVLEKNSAYMY